MTSIAKKYFLTLTLLFSSEKLIFCSECADNSYDRELALSQPDRGGKRRKLMIADISGDACEAVPRNAGIPMSSKEALSQQYLKLTFPHLLKTRGRTLIQEKPDQCAQHIESKYRETLRQLADEGNVSAMLDYAIMCKEGKGGKQDLQETYNYLLKAEAHGSIKAKVNLGCMYRRGMVGDEPDPIKALGYFVEASKTKKEANYNIAMMHLEGDHPNANKKEAFRLLSNVRNIMPLSYYYLGYMLENGVGCEQDRAQAIAMYTFGQSKGIPNCTNRLKNLLKK